MGQTRTAMPFHAKCQHHQQLAIGEKMDWCDKKSIQLKDWMLKRAKMAVDSLIIDKGVALFSLVQILFGMAIPYFFGNLLKTIINYENAGILATTNLGVYLVIFFFVLMRTADTEKSRPRLLFSGLSMIMLGVITADSSARFMTVAQAMHIGDPGENILFSNLLQNTYLYLSAAIGGGIVSSSIFQPPRIEKNKPKQCQCSASASEPPEETTKG